MTNITQPLQLTKSNS